MPEESDGQTQERELVQSEGSGTGSLVEVGLGTGKPGGG